MRKLFAIVIAASMLSGLYGLSVGVGCAYEDITDAYGGEAYFAPKVNVIVPVLPIFSLRAGLACVEFHSTYITAGTFISTDLMFNIPMTGMIQPYGVAGVWFYQDIQTILKGGLGADFGFGGFSAYLEGGVNYVMPDVGDAVLPIYAQAGVRFPLDL